MVYAKCLMNVGTDDSIKYLLDLKKVNKYSK